MKLNRKDGVLEVKPDMRLSNSKGSSMHCICLMKSCAGRLVRRCWLTANSCYIDDNKLFDGGWSFSNQTDSSAVLHRYSGVQQQAKTWNKVDCCKHSSFFATSKPSAWLHGRLPFLTAGCPFQNVSILETFSRLTSLPAVTKNLPL